MASTDQITHFKINVLAIQVLGRGNIINQSLTLIMIRFFVWLLKKKQPSKLIISLAISSPEDLIK